MTTSIDVNNMSPYLRDTVSEDTLRQAGKSACSYILRILNVPENAQDIPTNVWETAIQEAGTLTEILGIRAYPEETPVDSVE